MYTTDFTTSTARISALSDRLLTLSQVERMLAAKNADESFRILNDLSWSSTLSDVSGVSEFERVIESGLYDLKSTLVACTPSHDLLRYLLLRFDLQNVKSSLMAFIHGKEYEYVRNGLSSLSFYSRKSAFDILQGSDPLDETGSFFTDALLAAKKILDEDATKIIEAEDVLDGAFYKQMYTSVYALYNPVITDYFLKSVDFENMKKVLRRSSDFRIAFLTPANASQSYQMLVPEEASKLLELSPIRSFFTEAQTLLSEGKSISHWELSVELKLLNSLFWPSRANPLASENLLLLFLTKIRNSEVIRSILVGKRNNFSSDQVRDMISPFLPFLPSK